MTTIADTSPLNYLVQIGEIELVPTLFGRVLIPAEVRLELRDGGAPESVREWIEHIPDWVQIEDAPPDNLWPKLHAGERAAISLAIVRRAHLLLVDDRAGVAVARRLGFRVTGTIGVLDLANRRGLIDAETVIARLRATTFYAPAALLEHVLLGIGKGP